MTIDEQTRFDLRAYFRGAMGEDRLADALMEALPPIEYSELATKQDLLLTKAELRADMAELKSEIKGETGELKDKVGGLRTELKSDIADVRSEMSWMERSLNGQIRTGMALTVGSTLSTWGVMATLFGVFG